MNKWDLVKLKSFINKTKRQPTEWGEIFANDMTDKGLISNTYKQVTQLNIIKVAIQNRQKMLLKRHISEEDNRWLTGE